MEAKKNMIAYDITLLLLRYERTSVVRELAQQLEVSEQQLERELEAMRRLPRKPNKKKPVKEFSAKSLALKRPEIAEAINALDARYENRTFLPELKDVKRFLERQGQPLGAVKSRKEAKKRVFEVLLALDAQRVRELGKESDSASDSSLGLISDQILRR